MKRWVCTAAALLTAIACTPPQIDALPEATRAPSDAPTLPPTARELDMASAFAKLTGRWTFQADADTAAWWDNLRAALSAQPLPSVAGLPPDQRHALAAVVASVADDPQAPALATWRQALELATAHSVVIAGRSVQAGERTFTLLPLSATGRSVTVRLQGDRGPARTYDVNWRADTLQWTPLNLPHEAPLPAFSLRRATAAP